MNQSTDTAEESLERGSQSFHNCFLCLTLFNLEIQPVNYGIVLTETPQQHKDEKMLFVGQLCCCSPKKTSCTRQQLHHILQSEQQNRQPFFTCLTIYSCSDFTTLQHWYIFWAKLNAIKASFPNTDIKVGIMRFAAAFKSYRNNAIYEQDRWSKIRFALPPFEDLTSWNLQPRLCSDSEGLQCFFAVHHKISAAALHLI